MSATVHKVIAGVLGLTCIGLLVIIGNQRSELLVSRVANRRANDSMWIIRSDRNLAIKANDVTNAVAMLSKLQLPVMLAEYMDNRVLMHAVELEREKAIGEIIQFLRAKTGEDRGREPKDWIMAYGDAGTREVQEALEEWCKELRVENEARLKALAERQER